MSKKQAPKVGDLIEVYWWDHASYDYWSDKGCKLDLIECRSVGFVDRVDATSIQLYTSETNRNRISQQAVVLRSGITRIKVLQCAKSAAPKWTKT